MEIKPVYFWIVTAMIVLGMVAFAVFSNQGQQAQQPVSDSEKLSVAVTSYPLYLFASQLAGDRAYVQPIVPFSIEPHSYEPSPRDIVAFSKSNIVIYNGAGLEPWLSKMLSNSAPGQLLVDSSKGVEILAIAGHSHSEHDSESEVQEAHEQDPHVWLEPSSAIIQLRNIKNALALKDSANSDYYEQRFIQAEQELVSLDLMLKSKFSSCSRREFFITHPTLGYFCRSYGCSQIPIASGTHDSELSLKGMKELIELSKEHGIKAIIVEPGINQALAQSISSEAGLSVIGIDTIHTLETAVPQGVSGVSAYSFIMLENAKKLAKAMDCG